MLQIDRLFHVCQPHVPPAALHKGIAVEHRPEHGVETTLYRLAGKLRIVHCRRDREMAHAPRDAAAAIGISPSTLERLTRSGEIESVLVGRCRLYEVEALKAYLASRRVVGQEVTS